jgi:hypothetical protein
MGSRLDDPHRALPSRTSLKLQPDHHAEGRPACKQVLSQVRSEVKIEIGQIWSEVKAEISQLRTEVSVESSQLRNEIKADLTEVRIEISTRLMGIQTELAERPTRSYLWMVVGVMVATVLAAAIGGATLVGMLK